MSAEVIAWLIHDRCERCGDPVEEMSGCRCDGHVFCAHCLDSCPSCLAAIRESFDGA